MTVKIPDPPTPEDAAALAMDRVLFGRTVQDAETGARIDPSTITTERPLLSGRWVVHAPDRSVAHDMVGERYRNVLDSIGAVAAGAERLADKLATLGRQIGEWHLMGDAFNAKPPRAAELRALAHHRRPGARTLGAWRNKVALPEVLLDVLVGSDPPETVLTPETIVACGLLAVRTLRGAVVS